MRPAESFIEQPIRSLQTMLRVIAEDDPRLPTVVPDGIYGPTTMQAVAAFQRQYGIASSGITNQQTWDQIVAIYDNALIRVGKATPIEIIMDAGQVFQSGDRSPYIYLLQSILIQLSMEHPRIQPPEHNGTFDSETEAAVIAFQRLADLPPTGKLDKVTWDHLVRQYALYAHHINSRQYRSGT